MRGQVSKPKAYKSVTNVLAQYMRVMADSQLNPDRSYNQKTSGLH